MDRIAKIRSFLRRPDFFRIALRDEATSTNTLVKELGYEGVPEGYVMIAKRQTAGKGRMGRRFVSPEAGLYMSVLLRPDCPVTEAVRLTPVAAVAVSEAIRKLSGEPAVIKWVNDVYLGGRKVCGILTESALTPEGKADFSVVGIGVNIETPEGGFDPSVSEIAGAIYKYGESPEDYLERLAAEILNNLIDYYDDLKDPTLAKRYRELCFLPGKRVLVFETADGQSAGKPAEVITVTDDYGLLVRYSDGTEEVLTSGEVSVKLS